MIPDSILLLAINFALSSIVITALTLLFACFGRSLPFRHAILLAGLVACMTAPIAITTGWHGNWGRLPSYQLMAELGRSNNALPSGTVTDSNLSAHYAVESDSTHVLNSSADAAFDATDLSQLAKNRSDSQTEIKAKNRDDSLSAIAFESPASFNFARSIVTGLFMVWAIGILFALTSFLRRWLWAKRLVRACRPVNDPSLKMIAAKHARQLGITRAPKLLKSSSLAFPAVTGFRTPQLIIPENLLEIESESGLQMVLAHELAHISRKDHQNILYQAAACGLFWWNPLVYIVSSKLSRVRELICDDIAVASCGYWEEFARSIVSIADDAMRPRYHALPLGMSAGNLEQRITRLLARKGEVASTRLSYRWNSVLVVMAAIFVSSLSVAQIPIKSMVVENNIKDTRSMPLQQDQDNNELTGLDLSVMQELIGEKETPNIVFHYRPSDLNDKQLNEIIKINFKRFEECEKLLKMKYNGRVHVFLYRDVADLQKMTGTSAVAFSTGTVSVHQAVDFNSVHELTHIFALQFPREDDAVTDDFAVEGLATILAKSDENIPIHSWAAVYQSTSRLPDLVEFRRTWPNGLLRGVHPYHVAGSFVGYLIEKFGIEKVKRWYVQSTEAHMEFGKTFRRLERDWLEWLEKRAVKPEHRKHIQSKLGLIPDRYVAAKEIRLFDGASLGGLQADDASRWKAKNGRLFGSIDNSWTYIYSKQKFPTNIGLKVKFRMVDGKAVTIQLNRRTENGNHVNLATWATYMSLANGGYAVIKDLKIKPGEWNEIVVVNENGTGRLYLNGLIIHEQQGGFKLNEGSVGIGVEAGTIEVEDLVAFEVPMP